jgi:ferrochelatase
MMTNRAVLLTNLGSPDNTDVASVRRYLNQFLMDPYVIQLPWLLRRALLSLFILPKRPIESAKAYRSIWMEQGSPLVVLSARVRDQLQNLLEMPISIGMRYGSPSIEEGLLELTSQQGISEILFLPMYPHYADSTITTSVEEARRVIGKYNPKISLKVVPPFYDQKDYISALVDSARPHLDAGFDHVLFSYHGLPESHLKKTDPTGAHCLSSKDCCQKESVAHSTCYRHQVLRTTECFVQQYGLREGQYSLAFQSRLGRAKWLEPSTEQTIRKLGQQGVRKLLVLCPAFVTDCLETLEEIGIRGSEVFAEAGGETLELIPCLNDHSAWLEVLASWCQQPWDHH